MSDVGVGGLSLGGGISYFSAREGLVCDNIIAYQVVLASGEIIATSGETHSEFYRALKGGGMNFGIVTNFEIRCFEQGPFLGGCVASPLLKLSTQLDGFMALLEEETFDKFAAVIISLSWHQSRNNWMVFTNLEYTKTLPAGAEIHIPQCFTPFTETEGKLMDTMRVSTIGIFTNEMKHLYSAGMRNQFATTCISANRNVLDAAIETWKESQKEIEDVEGITWAMSLQPFYASYMKRGEGNVLALSPDAGPMVWRHPFLESSFGN